MVEWMCLKGVSSRCSFVLEDVPNGMTRALTNSTKKRERGRGGTVQCLEEKVLRDKPFVHWFLLIDAAVDQVSKPVGNSRH